MADFPKQVGEFRFWPPQDGPDPAWSMSDDGGWLPVLLADEDACMAIVDLARAGRWELLPVLNEWYNHARPFVAITVEHIAQLAAEQPDPGSGT